MIMPRPLLLLALISAQLLPLQGPARAAEAPCSDARSTVESTRCLIRALEAVDRRLEVALSGVAREAAGVPGESFHTLWRDNLTTFYRTSADPKEQAEAFRQERQQGVRLGEVDGVPGHRLRHLHHVLLRSNSPRPC